MKQEIFFFTSGQESKGNQNIPTEQEAIDMANGKRPPPPMGSAGTEEAKRNYAKNMKFWQQQQNRL